VLAYHTTQCSLRVKVCATETTTPEFPSVGVRPNSEPSSSRNTRIRSFFMQLPPRVGSTQHALLLRSWWLLRRARKRYWGWYNDRVCFLHQRTGRRRRIDGWMDIEWGIYTNTSMYSLKHTFKTTSTFNIILCDAFFSTFSVYYSFSWTHFVFT